MAIKHTFVSGKADSADPTVVNASNWNANHTIDNNTITYALMQQVSADKRVLGNNSGAAGNVSELTASQIFDMVSSTNGVLLTRTAGSWAAVANVTTDSGDLVHATSTATQPSAGSKAFARSVGGRNMLSAYPSKGSAYDFQPLLFRRKFWSFNPNNNGTTVLDSSGIAVSGAGTITARTPATTNMFTSAQRVGWVSASTANAVCGVVPASANMAWRGNAAGLGGFFIVCRFGISDAALVSGNMLVGLSVRSNSTTGAPSALANVIGFGCDSTDTVMQLYASGSVAQTRTSLGANFPANTVSTDWYEAILFAAPNDTQVTYQLTRLNTGDVASGTISTAANLPATTTWMTPVIWRNNAGVASAVAVDIGGCYLETEV